MVGDLGGFVASTYMRGIAYAQAPTTVLAQVDSAIGGKTAVNIRAAKNLVGTFYAPRLVVVDPMVLGSLSSRTFRSGLYEAVKHSILAGPVLFDWLENKLADLHPRDTRVLEDVVARAAAVKVDVVSRDEHEADLRRVLNLGHTYGHALEEATAYRRFLHGEAVAWGLLLVTRLAEIVGVLDPVGWEANCPRRAIGGSAASDSRPQGGENIGASPARQKSGWRERSIGFSRENRQAASDPGRALSGSLQGLPRSSARSLEWLATRQGREVRSLRAAMKTLPAPRCGTCSQRLRIATIS